MLRNIYLTLSPLILGGICNILFTKTAFYRAHKTPLDRGKCMRDGKRIFGDNKTVIGGISMILFCTLLQILCGILCNALSWNRYNHLYDRYPNTLLLNALFGALVGLIYILFELPNSFLKRRLGIGAGNGGRGLVGVLFFLLDQIDSLIGVMLLLCLFSGLGIGHYFLYLAVGAVTHVGINLILRLFKLRKRL